MSIEVRNFDPANGCSSISIYSNVEFDLVALDGDEIDISTLMITFETTSNFDNDTHVLSYGITDTGVVDYESSYGFSGFYHVVVDPDRPFDMGISVTVKINVDDILGNPMTEFESSFTTAQSDLISTFEYAFIDCAQKIPVYDEVLIGDSSSAPQVFNAAFGRWNQDFNPIIKKNRVIITSGYSIDYEKGNVKFDSPLAYNDEVSASYRFAFFNEKQINSFFRQAASIWITHPPFGGTGDIYSANSVLQSVYMIGAATFAFREILFCLAFQERRIIFDNRSWDEGWKNIQSLMKDMYESYKNDWEKLLEAKKTKLPAISAIVSPEYTLPGGRSRFFRYLYKSGAAGA